VALAKDKFDVIDGGNDKEAILKPSDAIKDRESKELVLAFAGPIGSGTAGVRERLENILQNAGYAVHVIKISSYLKKALTENLVGNRNNDNNIFETGVERYKQMQDVGNDLRKKQSDILAEYAIKTIAEIRTKNIAEDEEIESYNPPRTAYLIDQLKHPDEVSLLRTVYGNLFFQFGVLSSSKRRETRLKEEGIKSEETGPLMERDRREVDGHGQQLDKALKLADFFIRNDHANADSLERQLVRFVDLIHGVNGVSPTKDEYGMYVAYAAGLRSACLSRVVGASIMDGNGSVISTGRNDVPKGGGGLYGPEDFDDDARCVKLQSGICFNNSHKNKLTDDIEKLIIKEIKKIETEELQIPSSLASEISKNIQNETGVGNLIEFSRSIHAEMDAIISLSRLGGGSTQGATLFTYTFPCHNCARHIVSAGISKVYYLEPYEKSLATELHWDSINTDVVDESGTIEKVQFLHFEGVAPRQYLNIFNNDKERKTDDGKAIVDSVHSSRKKVPEYLDSYKTYEIKVTKHYESIVGEMKAENNP
jgi:deoxycytidylate deaminase